MWIAAAVVAGFGTAWWGGDLRHAACSNAPLYGSMVATPPICAASDLRIPDVEAKDFIDTFLGRAGAARPDEAWKMLDKPVQDEIGKETFLRDWTNILWAERLGPIRPGANHNTYIVHYRTFPGKSNEASRGQVVEYQVTVSLGLTDQNKVLMTGISLPDYVTGYELSYLAISPMKSANTFNRITTTSRVAYRAPAGSLLRALCQTEDQSGALWIRTPLGWIQGEDISPTADATEIVRCDGHHADSATRAELPQY